MYIDVYTWIPKLICILVTALRRHAALCMLWMRFYWKSTGLEEGNNPTYSPKEISKGRQKVYHRSDTSRQYTSNPALQTCKFMLNHVESY